MGFAVYDEQNLEAYREALADCDAVITGFAPIDEKAIDAMRNCKIISVQATGWNFVAHEYAKSRGIAVSAIGEYCTKEVADHTIMLMLMALRRAKLVFRHAAAQDSASKQARTSLASCTVGVVGTGAIGSCVIRELAGFGCRILACDPYPRDDVRNLAEYVELESFWHMLTS